MTVALVILACALIWYGMGALGMFLYFAITWRRSFDVRVDDVWFAAGVSLAGPFSLLIGLLAIVGEAVLFVVHLVPNRPDPRRIVWRRRATQ